MFSYYEKFKFSNTCPNLKEFKGALKGLPDGSVDKESVCNVGDLDLIPGFNHWDGKMPWRRAWQPTPVFLPGKSHEQRSLVGYSP